MPPQVRTFYAFLGLHSFLIGLFPFFIPVYLWNKGFSLSAISFFIALTGGGFCLTLYVWERLLKKLTVSHLICLSFVLECVLLTTFFLEDRNSFLVICGLLNGAYNCSFWILQRILFMEVSTPENSGNKFGNLQIVAFLFLKTAIILGGYLLDTLGFSAIFVFSTALGLSSITFFIMQGNVSGMKERLGVGKPMAISQLGRYRDNLHSRLVFGIDGIFLFLEAYFWVISLFTIVQESFWKLGILVVILAGIFGGLFLFIKNIIDRVSKQKIYFIAVSLYACSWFLRSLCDTQMSLSVLVIILAFVSFFTSFFRLAFNKRFFDLAKKKGEAYRYVVIKSYYSQFYIAIFFLVLTVALKSVALGQTGLPLIYFLAGIFAFVYLFYKQREDIRVSQF